MAQHDDRSPHSQPARDSGSNSTLFFIVGALVVAVGVIAYFLFGYDTATTTTPAGDTNTSVTIETEPDGGGATDIAPTETAPADDPAADAPAPDAPATDAPATDAPATEGN
ncbi:hypothetical protein [Vannielia sp.]|uniref:hypothetical protein n=1 Tax=Vannielia sp. TaxID=2813045 RepID=UPI00262F0D7B|nr:hypothetical protein [Vannielia sp.]MDF1871199.1 hypothetical protein [Vannielia sp.]